MPPAPDGDARPEEGETMNPITRAILVGGIALLVAGSAAAAAQTFPLECAQRDAKLVTQMEQHGEAQDVPGDILYEGYWTMKRAREACYQGRVVVGLALYDSIFRQSLAGLAQSR
jgi:rhamnose utilization protein RhaD (predicted bifunctional aldolase and dehydrogenase)